MFFDPTTYVRAIAFAFPPIYILKRFHWVHRFVTSSSIENYLYQIIKIKTMKTLFIMPAALFIMTNTSLAQTGIASVESNDQSLSKVEKALIGEYSEARPDLKKSKAKYVGYVAKEQFRSDFGNIPEVIWRNEATFDVATFKKDGMVESAYYDYSAQLVGTTIQKSFEDLPLKAQEYINKHYADYTKGDVILFDDNEYSETDMMLYGRQFEDEDNYFIELIKDDKRIVLESDLSGDVSYFTHMK